MSMLDFNDAAEQSQGTGVIPPNSIVPAMYVVEPPADGRQGTYAGLTRSQTSSLEYIRGYFEVVDGTYKGKKIYHNFSVHGASTSGQQKAVEISRQAIRALLEAHNQVSPKDFSQRACAMRSIPSWESVHGLRAFIKVKCKEAQNANGEVFVVNELSRIITVDDDNYQPLCQFMEMITNDPIPEVGNKQQTSSHASPAPSNQAPTNYAPQAQQAPTPPRNPAPNWTQPPSSSPPPQQQAQAQYSPPPQHQPQQQGFMPPPQNYVQPSELSSDDAPF